MINPDFSLAYYWDRLVTITALRSRIRFPGAEHIAFWLERRTRDRKVANSNPGRSGGRIFFSSQLCVLTLIRCSFHPRVTAVARIKPRSFCQKCR